MRHIACITYSIELAEANSDLAVDAGTLLTVGSHGFYLLYSILESVLCNLILLIRVVFLMVTETSSGWLDFR